MTLRRLLALVAVALAASAAAMPAAAKEDVRATLTSIPMSARPGEKIAVAWKLFYVDDGGRRRPFGASGVFVRLASASGAEASEAFSPDDGYPTGEYEASVVVPEGGIGDVAIGLMGWQSDATGTRRADMLFPIANEPAPTATIASPASARRPSPAGSSACALVAAAAAALAALAGALLLLRRRRAVLERTL